MHDARRLLCSLVLHQARLLWGKGDTVPVLLHALLTPTNATTRANELPCL